MKGPGVDKKHTAVLELIKPITTQDQADEILTLHRMQNLDLHTDEEHYVYFIEKIKKYLKVAVTDIICMANPNQGFEFWRGNSLFKERHGAKFAHYRVKERNIENPNLKKIKAKKKATMKLREQIAGKSKMLLYVKTNAISLKLNFARDMINKELAKYGHPPITKHMEIRIGK